MSNEEILDSELDSVAGGTYIQSCIAFYDLVQMGVIAKEEEMNITTVKETLDTFGIMMDDHGGLVIDNRYFIKETGKEVCYDDALDYVRSKAKVA